MHLYFMIRGIKQQVELFEMFLQTQMFRWDRKNLKTGLIETAQVQGSLRVIPFGYEYVFPEESLSEVLTMLNIHENKVRWNLGNLRTFFIRKLLGDGDNLNKVMPIPDIPPIPTNRYIEMKGIALYPIGIKKDKREAVEEWGYEQELL